MNLDYRGLKQRPPSTGGELEAIYLPLDGVDFETSGETSVSESTAVQWVLTLFIFRINYELLGFGMISIK